MEYIKNFPIYLQIEELIYENILKEIWTEGDKIPSVRELATTFEVNSNTVQKTISRLQEMEIIDIKRGIGNFISQGAYNKILQMKQRQFYEIDVKILSKKLQLLQISLHDFFKILQSGGSQNK